MHLGVLNNLQFAINLPLFSLRFLESGVSEYIFQGRRRNCSFNIPKVQATCRYSDEHWIIFDESRIDFCRTTHAANYCWLRVRKIWPQRKWLMLVSLCRYFNNKIIRTEPYCFSVCFFFLPSFQLFYFMPTHRHQVQVADSYLVNKRIYVSFSK